MCAVERSHHRIPRTSLQPLLPPHTVQPRRVRRGHPEDLRIETAQTWTAGFGKRRRCRRVHHRTSTTGEAAGTSNAKSRHVLSEDEGRSGPGPFGYDRMAPNSVSVVAFALTEKAVWYSSATLNDGHEVSAASCAFLPSSEQASAKGCVPSPSSCTQKLGKPTFTSFGFGSSVLRYLRCLPQLPLIQWPENPIIFVWCCSVSSRAS